MSWFSSLGSKASAFVKKNSAGIVKTVAVAGAMVVGGPVAGAGLAGLLAKGKKALAAVEPVLSTGRQMTAAEVATAAAEAHTAARDTVATGPPAFALTQRQWYLAAGGALLLLVVLLFAVTRRGRGP